jgi:hypothetical protein
MTVKITKPEINVREQLNELKKPTGVAGEAMLRAETPQEQQALVGVGRRNLIINGGFQVWQRSVSGTTPSSGWGQYHAADRWGSYYSGSVVSKQSATIDGTLVNTAKIVQGATNLFLYTKLESLGHVISGKTATLCFWAKSTTNSRLRVRLRFTDSGNMVNLVTPDIDTSSSNVIPSEWTKYTYTFNVVDTSNSLTRDVMVLFDGGSSNSTGDDLEFANVQLELGEVATPFEHRSYGEELALCQRYYQKLGGTAYQAVGFGKIYAAGQSAFAYVCFNTPMRTAPSASEGGNGLIVTDRVAYDDNVTSISGVAAGKGSLYATSHTGITRSDRHPVIIACRNGASGWLNLDAEL